MTEVSPYTPRKYVQRSENFETGHSKPKTEQGAVQSEKLSTVVLKFWYFS